MVLYRLNCFRNGRTSPVGGGGIELANLCRFPLCVYVSIVPG